MPKANAKGTKSTGKTTKPGKRVPKHGRGALNTGGTPGNKGGTGRPPDAWKAACRELVSSDEMLEKAKLVLSVPNHPAWLGAWKFLTEQGYGKPAQPVEASGGVELRLTFGTPGDGAD